MRRLAPLLFVLGALVGGAVGLAGADLLASVATLAAPAGSPVTGEPLFRAGPPTPGSDESAMVRAVDEVLPAVVTVVNKGMNDRAIGSGSGVVIDKARGYIVTNSHVIEQLRTVQPARYIEVVLSDGTTLSATVVGNDPATDVAVLRTERALPAEATLADSSQVPLAAAVVAIGSPGVRGISSPATGLPILQNSVTAGIVSAKGRELARADLRNSIMLVDLIQTDAAINPGNSGGPLISVATRQVIGLNTLVVRGSGEESLGFAISSNTVRTVAERLIAAGG